MHRTFRKLLENATGISERVIAVNIDIRDFSSFSKKVESPDVAIFIKKVYIKLIDSYFPHASFFKPTGDGLLITIPYTEEKLQAIARTTINSCLKVLRNFDSFCANDPMINFEVPRKVGIGLSRGIAYRLVSKNKTLDYSGRALNLASRLMDLARPTGIVFDADFGIQLLSDKQTDLFEADSVYIKGIAEKVPIGIYRTKGLIRISPLSRQPLDKIKWNTIEDTKTLKEIKDFAPTFLYYPVTEPIDSSEIKIKVEHEGVVRGKKRKGVRNIYQFSNFDYFLDGANPIISVDFDALAKGLKARAVKDSWPVNIKIIYPER